MKIGAVLRVASLAVLGWLFPATGWTQDAPYPSDGATDVPTSVNLRWSATQDATGYYLYIGTTPGTRDVVNTGVIPAPSYFADGLPASTTLYATFWARVDGTWVSGGSSTSFTTSDTVSPTVLAQLLTPGDEFEAIPRSLMFTWNAVPEASAYYLYVGNSPGTRDIINTGEIKVTSFQANDLPLDQKVYLRLWTKLSGTWRYRDYEFLVLGNATTLTRPVNNDSKTDPATIFEWRRLYGADRYYLYVGTAAGRKDVIDSGETLQTYWPNKPLAGGTTYYVRMYTKMSGVWFKRDYVFRTDELSMLTNPDDHDKGVEPATGFTWMPVADALKYYLYVGTTPGAKDVVNSGETPNQKLGSQPLPGGVTLYARMWVKMATGWRFRDTVFATRASPRFILPKPGQIGVSSSTTFKWTSVAGADRYTLTVGTTPGGDDVLAAVESTGTELEVSNLPAIAALYATIRTRIEDREVVGQVIFTTNATSAAARLLAPLDGESLPAGSSVKWRRGSLARAYRLEIGSSPDSADFLDTGEIQVTERFVEHLPTGVKLHARLTTYYLSGYRYSQSFTFTKQANDFPLESRFAEAERATAFIRGQGFGNLPASSSLLAGVVTEAGKDFANCVDYAQALVRAIEELGLDIRARLGAACLVPNAYDCHTYVEVENEPADEWFILDPTFGMAARRASDQGRATPMDISLATRAERWDDIEYVAVTPAGFAYAEDYYIDYPLMFYHLYDAKISSLLHFEESVLQLYEQLPAPFVSDDELSIAVRCAPDQTSALVEVGGVEQQIECSGADNLSELFPARSVVPVGDGAEAVEIYQSPRFAFGND